MQSGMIAAAKIGYMMKDANYLNDSDMKARFTIRQERVRLSGSTPVRVHELAVDTPVPPHDHDYYEICIVLAGSARHRTREGVEPLAAGDAVVICPGRVHAFDHPRGLRVANIYYSCEWLTRELGAPGKADEGLAGLFAARSLFPGLPAPPVTRVRLDQPQLAACRREIADLAAEAERPDPSPILLRSSLLKLLVMLCRAYSREGGCKMDWSREPRIAEALSLIELRARRGEPMRVGQLAESLALSSDHLARLFRSATGSSPMAHYQRRRCHHAAAMLMDPGRSVTEVSANLGFADAAHFSRLFKEHFGVAPRTWRSAYAAADKPARGEDVSSILKDSSTSREKPS